MLFKENERDETDNINNTEKHHGFIQSHSDVLFIP